MATRCNDNGGGSHWSDSLDNLIQASLITQNLLSMLDEFTFDRSPAILSNLVNLSELMGDFISGAFQSAEAFAKNLQYKIGNALVERQQIECCNQAALEGLAANLNDLNLLEDVIEVRKADRELQEEEVQSAREQLDAARASFEEFKRTSPIVFGVSTGLTFGLAMMAILLSNGLLIPVVAATGLAGQVLGTHLTLNRTKERIERTVSNCESDQVQKTEGLESAESDLFWAEIEKQATLSNLDTASLQLDLLDDMLMRVIRDCQTVAKKERILQGVLIKFGQLQNLSEESKLLFNRSRPEQVDLEQVIDNLQISQLESTLEDLDVKLSEIRNTTAVLGLQLDDIEAIQ